MNEIADCQAELNLRVRAARTVNADSVNELCGLLRGRKGMTAAALRRLRPEWDERFIRELASASGGRVLSAPGIPYCLAEEVETELLDHAGRSLMSQGRKMARRGIKFLRLAALRRAEAALIAPAP